MDIFSSDAFGVINLTQAIEQAPIAYNRIGQLGLFKEEGVTTTVVAIEYSKGKLSLIPTAARGTMPEHRSNVQRIVRNFSIPHLPKNDTVLANAVQDVRAFGSNDQVEGVSTVIAKKLQNLKQDHETTWEFHRAGALSGVVLDADGSTAIYNLFTEFGISETVVPMVAATAGSVRNGILSIKRSIEDALGSLAMERVHCLCSPGFFEKFVGSADVAVAYSQYVESAQSFLREDQRITGFTYQGVTFEEYRASIGGTPYIAANSARFFPIGVPGLYMRYNAPGTMMEAVNTIGKSLYAKQEIMKFDMGVELHTQSNPLHIVTIPSVLVKGTIS